MALSNYVLPLMGSGALFGASYMLGRFGYSIGWILIFVGLGFVKTKLWKQREQRLLALRTAALREKEVVLANLQDLPAWVQFPDTERVEWINKVIGQLWPYIGEYTKQFMTEVVEPQVKAALPGPFKSFRFVQVDMGDIPLRVGGIKVYTDQVGRDRVIMDMTVAYAGDSNFDIQVGMFKAGLNEVQFQGKLRVVLKPLLPYPPMVGGVSAYFMEPPTMDFNLTGLGEMIELPGLLGAIRTVIDAQVASLCVLPNEIVVSLAPNLDLASLYFPEPDGVVRIHVVQAKNLMDLDTFLKGKSDPYALVKVGSQTFKTKTVDDNLNPEWNEIFEAVVDQASGQKFRMELYDEDVGSNDEELGRLTLDLSTVRDKGIIDKWYALEACKKGDVYVKLYWMNLCKNPADLDSEAEQWEKEWQGKIHPALVSVYVDNVSNLPYPKAKVEPSPFITLTLGKETKETVPKVNTVNPLFQQKFQFWCHSVESQHLKVEAFDSGTKRPLGDVTIGINRLLTEPKMELYQHTFHLTLGTHQSPIVLTVRLRALKGVQATTNAAEGGEGEGEGDADEQLLEKTESSFT